MDGDLPSLLKRIVSRKELFGPEVYSMVLAIVTFYLNEEPNSFGALHEVNLITSISESILLGIPMMGCVIHVIPNMIRAICLNPVGISLIREQEVLRKYFSLFSDVNFVDVLEHDTKSMYIGALCDELMRHVPALKSEIVTQIFTVFDGIQALCVNEHLDHENWEDILFHQSIGLRLFSYMSEVRII
jgi:E3 ubiquitin-protein ligase HUWE1